MKLILEKDVKNLGKAGDKVSVKPGYARNWLIPQKAASVLNESRLKEWKHKQHIIAVRKKTAEKLREKTLSHLKNIRLVFDKEARPDGRLFGSLPPAEIAKALFENHKLSIDKKDIHSDPLKSAGEHSVKISLDSHREVLVPVLIKQIVKKTAESNDDDDNREESGAAAPLAPAETAAAETAADGSVADRIAEARPVADAKPAGESGPAPPPQSKVSGEPDSAKQAPSETADAKHDSKDGSFKPDAQSGGSSPAAVSSNKNIVPPASVPLKTQKEESSQKEPPAASLSSSGKNRSGAESASSIRQAVATGGKSAPGDRNEPSG